MYFPANGVSCYGDTCGTVGQVIRPASLGSVRACNANMSTFGLQNWTHATSISVDASALLGDFVVKFRHEPVTDLESYLVEMNTFQCSPQQAGVLCPQIVVSPFRIERTACFANECDFGGLQIVEAGSSYNASTRTWSVVLDAQCYGEYPAAAPAATVSAFLLAVVLAAAAWPLLPFRFLFAGGRGVRGVSGGGGGGRWWNVAAAGGAALGLGLLLIASGDFRGSSSGAIGADASCRCDDTDAVTATITFYHSPYVLIDGASSIDMDSSVTLPASGVLNLACTNATCWSMGGISSCDANDQWDNGCMEGRPLVVEDGGEALRADVSWVPLPLTELGSADSSDEASWVPYLSEHLAELAKSGSDDDAGAADNNAASTESLSALARSLSPGRWLEQGLDEHASVASFNRFSLNLMRHGAPASLVRRAQQAAMDETKHAELSFSLAAALNATEAAFDASKDRLVWFPVPGDIPMPNPLPLDASTQAMLEAAFWEGCIGEMMAAARASVEAQHLRSWVTRNHNACASSPGIATCVHVDYVLRAVEAIADEEAGHAVLAWKSIEWLLTVKKQQQPQQPSVSDDVDVDVGQGAARSDSHLTVFQNSLRSFVDQVAKSVETSSNGPVDAAVAVQVISKLTALAAPGTEVELPDTIIERARSVDAAVSAGVSDLLESVLRRW